MADIIPFPARAASNPRAIIALTDDGFDVTVQPPRPGEDLDAFFTTYDSAEAYAFGLHRALGLEIHDAPKPERAA